jgi:hypothetical protein
MRRDVVLPRALPWAFVGCPYRAESTMYDPIPNHIATLRVMQQRSPITFWLLLAATVAVDAVVFLRVGGIVPGTQVSVVIYARIAFDAILVSQLSLVCIWAVLNSDKLLWGPVLVAILGASFIGAVFGQMADRFVDAFRLYFSVYAVEASMLFVALWGIRGTRFWRRRTGSRHEIRYSVAQLLSAMTIMAVLLATTRNNPIYGSDDVWFNVGFECSIVLMATASVLIWCSASHWLLRLAATFALAIVLGLAFWLIHDFGTPFSFIFVFENLIQAVVLSAWLGWGPILPQSVTTATTESVPRVP